MASASDHRAHAALQPADCLILLPQRLPAAAETSIGPAHYPAECTQSDAFLQPSLRARNGRANSNSFLDKDRRLLEARVLEGPRQRDGEDPDEYAQRKAIASATILGWLALHDCQLSAATQQELPKLRAADPRWGPAWDASADHSNESRGGSVSVNTDASKILDAPLAELIPLAAEHTKHPFFEFTEYRPFDGLVKDRPFRALSSLSWEA